MQKPYRFVSVSVVTLLLFTLVGQLALAAPPKPEGGSKIDTKAVQQPPIQLGTSGGNANDIANGYCCSGTLGALVEIAKTQYILSNTHVFAGDSVRGGNQRTAGKGDPITQPGNVDIACRSNTAQVVASLSNWSPLLANRTTPVDAAVAEVAAGMVRPDGAILGIGVLSSDTLAAFPGLLVKKTGRTTGLTRSSVSAINVAVIVGYSTECAGTEFTTAFEGQIFIKNKGSRFLNSGDSGSVMVEDLSVSPRAVGLLFAGSSTIAVANPIGDVLGYFGARMVGASATGAPDDLAAGPDSMPRGQLAKAMRLQQVHGNRLARAAKGLGHGVGAENGQAVIKVFVEEITPEALAAVPRDIEDVPVVVEAIGKVVAF